LFFVFFSDSVLQRKSQGTSSNQPKLQSISFRWPRINIIYYNLIILLISLPRGHSCPPVLIMWYTNNLISNKMLRSVLPVPMRLFFPYEYTCCFSRMSTREFPYKSHLLSWFQEREIALVIISSKFFTCCK
jgi:hypothetical protein